MAQPSATCNVEPSTATRSAFDNDECHVTAFRPISETAHSWSYDKITYSVVSRTVSQRGPNLKCGQAWSRWTFRQLEFLR